MKKLTPEMLREEVKERFNLFLTTNQIQKTK